MGIAHETFCAGCGESHAAVWMREDGETTGPWCCECALQRPMTQESRSRLVARLCVATLVYPRDWRRVFPASWFHASTLNHQEPDASPATHEKRKRSE